MVFQELKRCCKSKINILIVALMFAPVISAIMDELYHNRERLYQVDEMATAGYDVSWYLSQIDSGGLYIFERLLFTHTGFLFFSLAIFVIGVGINVAGNLFSALKTGYGINVVTRIAYKCYLKKTLLSHFLYIVTFILVVFSLFLAVSLFVSDAPFQMPRMSEISLEGSINIFLHLLILSGIVLYIALCKALLILAASLSFVYLKNKYILQFAPVAFYVGAYVFAFIFGNLSEGLALVARALIFEHSLFSLTSLFSWSASSNMTDIVFVAFHPLLLLALIFILYKQNVSKYGRDYLV